MQRYRPVSYTHLDVYKRQTQEQAMAKAAEISAPMMQKLDDSKIELDCDPVSYTHLAHSIKYHSLNSYSLLIKD